MGEKFSLRIPQGMEFPNYWALCVNIVGCVYSVIPIYVATPPPPAYKWLTHCFREALIKQEFGGHFQNIEILVSSPGPYFELRAFGTDPMLPY